MILVPFTAGIRAGVSLYQRRLVPRRLLVRRRLRKGGGGLILVAVSPHVHTQIRIPLKPFPADRAEMRVRRQDLLFLKLQDLVGSRNQILAFLVVFLFLLNFVIFDVKRRLLLWLWRDEEIA